ncbi:MAG: ABC transporter substrate-binding protein [Nitrospirae bacterium]|nr:MAG: ABC transporter substrate-binding protein [Nitrospirota bacterium]
MKRGWIELHVKSLVVWCGAASLWVGMCALAVAGGGSATAAVKETVDQVLAILQDEALQQPERAQERRQLLEEVVSKRFDYEEMSKRTLGRYWHTLTPAQQQEFVALFKQYLSATYAKNVDGYSGERVEYLRERQKGNKYAEVQTKVISEKLEVPLSYRLLKKSGDWRVYDVVIDGVSLVKNFRGQFTRIIKDSSMEGLFEKLRKKTRAKQAS